MENTAAIELSSDYIKSEPVEGPIAVLSPLPANSSSTIPLAALRWTQFNSGAAGVGTWAMYKPN
jgi:hypothetical protein